MAKGGRKKLYVFIGFLFLTQNTFSANLNKWRDGTLSSLDKMRVDTSLINDGLILETRPNDQWTPVLSELTTSPTNLGLDLILQLDILEHADFTEDQKAIALSKIDSQLNSLAELPFEANSGLFFGWYNPQNKKVLFGNLSSVDNIHLAFALWTAKERLEDPIAQKKAEALFKRMNFSIFFDSEKKLIIGNLLPDANGGWKSEGYYYSNYGSEARSIYILSYVLGLFDNQGKDWITDSLNHLNFELSASRKNIRLWDGGAFQLFLPDLLISERTYSSSMQEFFKSYAQNMKELGKNYPAEIPAAHSACFFKDHEERFFYNGNAGLLSETSQENRNSQNPKNVALWEAAFTPHALLLASLDLEANDLNKLEKLENITENGLSFFRDDLGWLDAWQWKSNSGLQLVNLQIALDQLMLVLSLNRLSSADKLSVSARALKENPLSQARLSRYYQELDLVLKKVTLAKK